MFLKGLVEYIITKQMATNNIKIFCLQKLVNFCSELFDVGEGFIERALFRFVQIELDDFFYSIFTEDGGNSDEISAGIVLAVAIGTA